LRVASMFPLAAKPMPPMDSTCQVGNDVAKQVVGDNDVETSRISHQIYGGSVDVAVVNIHIAVFLGDLIHGAFPQ